MFTFRFTSTSSAFEVVAYILINTDTFSHKYMHTEKRIIG